MPTFHIDLIATAYVQQMRIPIEADTLEEAMTKAVETAANRSWEYDGVDDETIEPYQSRP